MRVKVGIGGIFTLCVVIALSGASYCAFADQLKVKKLSKRMQQKQAQKQVSKENPNKPEVRNPAKDQDLSMPEDEFPAASSASSYRKEVHDFIHGKSKTLRGYDALRF